MVTVTLHCNLRLPDIAPWFSAHNAPVYKFNNSASARDVSTIGEYYHSVFWPNFYCTCAETVISELSGEILTLPLESKDPISYMVGYLVNWWAFTM